MLGFQDNIRKLIKAGILKVIHISSAIYDEAWDVFERYNIDKKWSFTDCVSYVVMKQQNIETVFAFDHHFEQMGFNRKP